MQKILIIGATSAIAEATARIYAQQGDSLYLLGRNRERLAIMVQDLKLRGANEVNFDVFDVNDFDRHKPVLETAAATLGGIDIALLAHGTLPDQKACEQDFQLTLREFKTNAISTISLLTHLANFFERQHKGTIAVISSVAGDRGRQSNYVYGAAKGAVTVFLQGLRNRLYKAGVHVLTIKPGFIDTPMTVDFKKGMLWAKPEQVAKGIEQAIRKRKNSVYLPGFWALFMLVIKHIPEMIFKRLAL
jgi:short-subunit dehydrogenase